MTETANGGVKELLESTCDLERVAVVFNPASGVEDLTTRRSGLEKLVRGAGLQCELTETDKDTGAAPLARKAVEDRMERVLVSGGDGSVTEAADILAGTDVTLGVLPGGTGNLLALNLGIPADSERALDLALKGQPRAIDVGRANGKVFLILAGMGADARMIRDADRETKQRLGVMAYFLAALRQIRRQRVRYTIRIDGRTLVRRAMTVMVANLGRITAGVELVPGCDPYDGLLEVAILRVRGPIDIAALALSVLLGSRRRDLLEV
ncbi:MAG: diacylglycerol kinase, partial [Chloroflexi bacterium]|nr:diacylglycerol kinase [Chloroflexota bacterium]